MSGKTGLTYAEAVESEERAARLIDNFPPTTYVKDRYFIGETCLLAGCPAKNDAPKQCRVVEVLAPEMNGDEVSGGGSKRGSFGSVGKTF